MKTTILKAVLLLVTLAFLSCINIEEFPQNQLPAITQTGANTFGCIINGEILIPKDGLPSLGGPKSSKRKGISVNYDQNNNFIIYAGNFRGETKPNIYIYIHNLTSTGTYSFGLSNGENSSAFEPNYPHCWTRPYNIGYTKKYLSNTNSGTITITKIDTVNKIVSGTFQLTAFDENNSEETIEITDGRFDMQYPV